MDHIVEGFARFRSDVFPRDKSRYRQLAVEGQKPQALLISCSDSRVMPEIITQCGPGDIFVTRNAGNIVPPFGTQVEGVTSAIEYAVVGLGVKNIIVCGHTDCGAMKAVLNPEALNEMPRVKTWLGHCTCAHDVFRRLHGGKITDKNAARTLAMENVIAQLLHLRTHPSVAARLATGDLTLHGWLFDIEKGELLAMDGETGAFSPISSQGPLPVAQHGERRASPSQHMIAAE